MYLPASRPDPIVATDSSQSNDFAALARVLAERGGVALVYAPSTTTITNTTPSASPAPIEVRLTGPAGPVAPALTRTARPCSRYTFGEVIAYCGLTLMGGGIFSVLVTALLRVPELVPVLGGSTGLAGILAALVGFGLDQHERNGGAR